jgi:hypothetical protein
MLLVLKPESDLEGMSESAEDATTGLYDRRYDDISVGEVERIGI